MSEHDLLHIRNAVFYAYHGVGSDEQNLGGKFEVDVSLEADLSAAKLTDDLKATVNYEAVYAFVRELITTRKYYLIEALAYKIASGILGVFPGISQVSVLIRKPHPPVKGVVDHVEVELTERRNAPVTAYVGLGSNLGDRMKYLLRAVGSLASLGAVRSVSSVYETQAVGLEGPDFLNAVAEIETTLPPAALFAGLKATERCAGRSPNTHNMSREIDLDLLLYADIMYKDTDLQIPHPRLHSRRFALQPLNELASGVIHPQFREQISVLLSKCPDGSNVVPTGLVLSPIDR